ncbi:ribonuclease P protein component [Corynebacterium anserum]|uniref:Ribonuclease P protein component n=1 Tax=Corynebacterium anserum TaxID=2684406 RepID=A0A7G7YQP3_9CORY|nr:ribonuclease P protein component [Corynebacterium anserum]MBC2682515.1 ribonuclease P protein component [Corynebacterium anserum]QNH96813.1 ribonuclease P protein component [Corynebacterium anserum]
MLSEQNRLRSSAAFAQAVKHGRKKGSRTVVVYKYEPDNPPLVTNGGPRMGVIVSKAVGNSVVRHKTARIIRAALRNVMADPRGVQFKDTQTFVIRALPYSATAQTGEVEKDVRSCLRRIAQQKTKSL